MLGVNVEDQYDQLVSWLDGLGGVSYTILLDQYGQVETEYNIQCTDAYAPYPREVIIDQDGIITYTACEYDSDRVEAEIESLLD